MTYVQRWPQTAGHSPVSPVQYKILEQYKPEVRYNTFKYQLLSHKMTNRLMLFIEMIQLLLEPYGNHQYVLRPTAEPCNVAAGGTIHRFTDLNVT